MEQPQTSLVDIYGYSETMVAYFNRFKRAVSTSRYKVQDEIHQPGLYLFKRPIITKGGVNPLAACGSVYHHCVVFLKQANGQVHKLDYGPCNGADVTSNITEYAKARPCLELDVDVDEILDLTAPNLPFLYIGLPVLPLSNDLVQKAMSHLESQKYHALYNNCIHFADTIIRVLTVGRVRNAPMLFDVACGEVPTQDNMAVYMLQMMMQLSWMAVCDGTKTTNELLEAFPELTDTPSIKAAMPPGCELTLPGDHHVADLMSEQPGTAQVALATSGSDASLGASSREASQLQLFEESLTIRHSAASSLPSVLSMSTNLDSLPASSASSFMEPSQPSVTKARKQSAVRADSVAVALQNCTAENMATMALSFLATMAKASGNNVPAAESAELQAAAAGRTSDCGAGDC